MPKAMLRPTQYLLAIALFFALGGHWFVLQSVAWGRMIVVYSHAGSVTGAVAMTFDGKHPCDLCKTLSKARETEKKGGEMLTVKKMEMIHDVVSEVIYREGQFRKMETVSLSADALSLEPSVPPPRRS